jgi:hypothetical protein
VWIFADRHSRPLGLGKLTRGIVWLQHQVTKKRLESRYQQVEMTFETLTMAPYNSLHETAEPYV